MLYRNPSKLIFAATTGALAWFALIMQFVMGLWGANVSGAAYVVRFFSYFTVLSNALVALHCSYVVFSPKHRQERFLDSPAVVTAITLYIVIVGLIYNAVLRFLVQPQGLLKLVDELLHVVIPCLFFFYWWSFAAKHSLNWKLVCYWLLFPLVYLLYTLSHGVLSDFYPYPFVDVTELGIQHVLLNSFVITVVFLAVGLLLISLTRWKGRYRNKDEK
ncbi:Pr6Pr family membrane protein [Sphingobacterium thalpophilum]|uniref:Pr6Pr family membrane protein n=1 Tax=Sphingobacterium thalpophilum TaxID=259 RepID=UPI003C75EB5A